MASVSIGDFIAISTLLKKLCTDCKNASDGFSDLSQFVESSRYAVDSARYSVENVFDDLPWVHKQSISSALWGLHGVAKDLEAELTQYAILGNSNAGVRGAAMRVKFALLENPQEAEAKLSTRISMLNTCISAIICDAVTRSCMSTYDPAQMVARSKQLQIHEQSSYDRDPSPSPPLSENSLALPLSKWITSTTDEVAGRRWYTLSRKQSGPSIMARGFYDYQPQCEVVAGSPRIDTVEYELRVSRRRIVGTCVDALGTASIKGVIDTTGLSVCFIKEYTAPLRMVGIKWEYSGACTDCGIVGEWYHPGDPLEKAHFRGRFGMWLQKDEESDDAEASSQIEALSREGRVLSRAGTFKRR